MSKSLLLRVLITLLLTSIPSFAQNLADVLSSIQERKVAIEQRRQVIEDYEANFEPSEFHTGEDWPYTAAPDQIEPIDWVFTSQKYPTSSQLDSLTLEQRVTALNIAISAFDGIKSEFLNIPKTSLTSGARAPAHLNPYNEFDLPSLGRADHGNYHALLRALAVNVLKLSAIKWPYNAKADLFYSEQAADEYATVLPEVLGGTTGAGEPFFTGYFGTDLGIYASDLIIITGRGNANNENLILEAGYHGESILNTQLWLKSKHAPSPPTGVELLSGQAVLFSQDHYNPTTGFSRDGVINPATEGRFKRVGAAQVGASQAEGVEITVPEQEFTVTGTWVTIPAEDVYPNYFVPTGRSFDEIYNGEEFRSDEKGFKPYFAFSNSPLEGYVVNERTYQCVMMPEFVKGLDANPAAVATLKNLAPMGIADPVIQIAPNPSVLLSIALGSGSNNSLSSGGLVLFQPKYQGIPSYGARHLSGLNFSESILNPKPVDHSFATELIFTGSHEDFHVHYETRRSTGFRAPLPEWSNTPGTIEDWDTVVHGWKSSGNFLAAWDKPRLRQVVGKQIVADIEYGITPSDYERKVTLRRVPAGGSLTPGENGLVDVSAFPVIRILTFKNPGHANGWAGTNKYSLEVTDSLNGGDEKWIIKSNDPSADPGLDDWTLEAKKGSTLSAKTNHQWSDENNKLTTAIWSGAGASPATTAVTIYPVDEDWFDPLSKPSSLTLQPESAEQITTAFEYSGTAYYTATAPSKITITKALGPDSEIAWKDSGITHYSETGDSETPEWRTDYTIEGGITIKSTQKFKGSTVSTNWVEWTSETLIKNYSAPDGTITSKSDAKCSLQTITLHDHAAAPIPWAVQKTLNKDGTGSFFHYTQEGDAITFATKSGVISNNAVSEGSQSITVLSGGHPVSSTVHAISGGQPEVLLSQNVWSELNDWGAPEKSTSQPSGLATTWVHDGAWMRISGSTNPLGVTTDNLVYDAIGRATNYDWNGNSGTLSFTDGGKSIQNSLPIAALGDRGWNKTSDGVGNPISARAEGGQPTELLNTYTGGQLATQITDTATEVSLTNTTDLNDGSLTSATGTTLAYGGIAGDALSIVDGLFVSKTAVAEVPGTFATTHTDAWGRTHKVVTPSKSSGTTQITYSYSLPAATLKRVITTDPSGRKMITESDTVAMVSRSGIDVNGNGELGASDRYTESTTEINEGNIKTTLSVTEDSGMREVLETTFTPATGVTVSKINGNEETITQTLSFPTQPPLLYPTKTMTITSSKGWSRVEKCNNLGLPIDNDLSGTGIPATSLNPVWRADGSLENVSLSIGGETHTASFNENNTLASLTAPGRGNILGEHSISNGIELLTVNGKTVERSLDGTNKSTSGANVIGKSEVLSKSGSGYKNTVTPAVGAATETAYNAALATTTKTYADSTGKSLGYSSELLASISLARGGAISLGYSNDGAKDLTAATWPAMASGPFTIPAIGHGFEYNRSGQIKTHTDPSGTRSLTYFKGRMNGSLYTGGVLKGYQIIPGRDEFGRQTGTLLKRDGNAIHTTAKALNGASDQVTNLASGNITATPQRNAAGNITGYIWSDGTNSVTQTWIRGVGGRIEEATSDVPNAPSFDYAAGENTFDALGRRLKCETAGGTWTYVYGSGGQLTSATHPTLGTFNYAFDGIGRRTDKGTANTTDILNRTTAWTHSQNKTLSIKAHPDARVWFNGVEIPNFDGNHDAAITPPGVEGGWVPWETLAIIEDAGEGAGNPAANPLADPDAKSEKSGAVWVPPAAETFTFDAAGNRQSSAQWDFGWDAKNQLARVRTKNHTTAAQAYDITFTYDSEGRRIKKHVIEFQNGAVVSEKIITFIWDGWDLLYERHQLPSGLTTLERKYLWGPDIADGAAGGAGGLLLIRETKGNATTNIIPLCDGTGHVIALTNINKDLLASYQYGPFGEKILATGSQANSNPWRWGTKYLDQETGLYYYGHRYYDPITGQWMSRDPLGENETVNLYQFAGNDPINKIDVHGLSEVEITNDENSGTDRLLRLAFGPGGYSFFKWGNKHVENATDFATGKKGVGDAISDALKNHDPITQDMVIEPGKSGFVRFNHNLNEGHSLPVALWDSMNELPINREFEGMTEAIFSGKQVDYVYDANFGGERVEHLSGGQRVVTAGSNAVLLAMYLYPATRANTPMVQGIGQQAPRLLLKRPTPAAPLPIAAKGGRGPATAWSGFDESLAGGPLRNLSIDNARVTPGGIGLVEKHLARFGPDNANTIMVGRLKSIASGDLVATPTDLRFYLHEIREGVRYRNLGWAEGVPSSLDDATNLWRQTHSATLQEYGLPLRSEELLYVPEALKALGF